LKYTKKQRKIALILALVIILGLFPNTKVFADGGGIGGSDTVKINPEGTELQFYPSYQKKKGYNYGDKIFYKNFWKGKYGSYMPFRSGETDMYGAMKSMKENNINKYGRNGEHLVNPNDWNYKLGRKDPTKWGRKSYMGDGSGTMHNREHRYIGYVKDGSVFDNPFFPEDVYTGRPPASKDWQKFGTPADHQKRVYNLPKYRMDPDDPNSPSVAQYTIEEFLKTDVGKTFKAKNPDWKYWNDRFEILTDIRESAGVLKGYHKVSKGVYYYQMFVVPGKPETNTWINKMELKEKGTGKVIGYAYREIDPTDPMNTKKMKRTKLSGGTKGGVTVTKGKTYVISTTIKYLNLTGAKSRDITNPDVVNKELTTKTTSINADELYQFDKITYNDFDIGPNPHLSYDKPEKLKNLEEANFEWEFTIPQNVKKFMRFWAKVPVEFQENGDNMVSDDDWAFIDAKVEGANLRLPNLNGKKRDDRFVTDDSGNKQDRMIVLDKDGKKMVSREEASRTEEKATPLKPGETYTVKVWMQNMNPPKHDTENKGIKLNRYVAYYNGKLKDWDWSDTVEKGGGIKNLNYTDTKIPIGKTAYYEWKYTVPKLKDKKQNIRLAWKIPDIPEYKNKDNSNSKDDYTRATFPMSEEDMLMDQEVILLNSKGQKVNQVQPMESHTVIFRVWKNIGDTQVKDPKATINVELEDGAGVKTIRRITHDKILDYGEYVEFKVPVVPTVPWLRASAVIDEVHHKKGVNDDLKNDSVEKVWATELNLAVNNFSVTPSLITIQDSSEAKTLTFNYTLTSTADIYLNGVMVDVRIISPRGQTLYSIPYNFAPHESKTITFSDIFYLSEREYKFEVEINPKRDGIRPIKEYKANSIDPYNDNIDRASTKVIRTKDVECMECKNNGPRKENKWKKTFKMRQDRYIVSKPMKRWICTEKEWVPEREVCHADGNGGVNCYITGDYYT
jgi:hypothetical protein